MLAEGLESETSHSDGEYDFVLSAPEESWSGRIPVCQRPCSGILFDCLANFADTDVAWRQDANTGGAAARHEEQAGGHVSHSCLWTWWFFLGQLEIESVNRYKTGKRYKTKASEEVLDGVLVKEVVLDAVVALVQQLPVLGDEVSDWPGGKLLVEVVLHVVDQHLNVGVDPHLLLHFLGHSTPLFNGVVAWYVNHLDQMLVFLDVLASLSSTWRVCVSTFSMTWPKPARFSLDHRARIQF